MKPMELHLKKNGLHNALGVKPGHPIPHDLLNKALNSSDPHMRKMAQFAKNAARWGKREK